MRHSVFSGHSFTEDPDHRRKRAQSSAAVREIPASGNITLSEDEEGAELRLIAAATRR